MVINWACYNFITGQQEKKLVFSSTVDGVAIPFRLMIKFTPKLAEEVMDECYQIKNDEVNGVICMKKLKIKI